MPHEDDRAGLPELDSLKGGEVWKPVYGYGRVYHVSSHGRVKGLHGLKSVRYCKTYGYYRVDLWRKNKRRTCLVHRLVARAFLGKCPKGHTVHHADFDRAHNHIRNLTYLKKAVNDALHSEHADDPDYQEWYRETNENWANPEYEQLGFEEWKRIKTEVPF